MSIKGAGRGFSSGANFNPRNYTNEGRPSLIEEITEGSMKSQQQQVKGELVDGQEKKSATLDPPLKMRMISLLKSTFGEDDLIKIPGFLEFETATRQELIDFNRTGGTISISSHSNLRRIRSLYVDASTQTSLDLLDTFLRSSPRYSSKIVSSLNELNSSTNTNAAAVQGPSSFIPLGSNNLSGNNHQRIWESSQPLNGRQAWLVGQSSGSHSITGPIMMTAPIQLQGRNLIKASSHATSNVQGLVTNYLPSSSGDVSTSMFVSETRGGMGLETTLSPSGLRMRVQQRDERGGIVEPGNWSGSNKSHNILSAPLTLAPSSSISFSHPPHLHQHPPLPPHTGHYNIMSSQHQPLLSNLRTTSSGLPEPLPPPIDFSPLPLPHQGNFEQRFEQQQQQRAIQQHLQSTTRSRGSTASTNQRSSEESLHGTGVGGGITPGQGSVVEESASSGGDSSPSSSGAVYKNIIITLASSRIPSGHLREDDEDDDRERMTLGSFDDGEEEDDDDEDLSLGPGLEHHHCETTTNEPTTSCPPPSHHYHPPTTGSHTHTRHHQQQQHNHLKR